MKLVTLFKKAIKKGSRVYPPVSAISVLGDKPYDWPQEGMIAVFPSSES